jgi:phosphoribosylamine--glycine ligase
MKILVLGSGGREHAIVWKLSQSRVVDKIYCIPGNGGVSQVAECVSLSLENFTKLSDFVKEHNIDFTIVGPEAPLVAGVSEHFKSKGLKIFAPDGKSARLEGSKIFSKNFMKKYNMPTADFEVFDDYDKAVEHISQISNPPVVKADGLCAGKGVIVCDTKEQAKDAARKMLVEKVFGSAGEKIIIEEKLTGQEISVIAFCDGETILPLPTAQDHKRAYDNDAGPNTGGMGAYSPVPFVSKEIMSKIKKRVIENFIKGVKSERMDYCGMIYFGLLLVNNTDPCVLEFNVRFGDPETQPVLPLLNTDLVELFSATIARRLKDCSISIKDECSICVVIASGGYPGSYEKGKEITGLDKVKNAVVFHAGTKRDNGKFYTNGGRVLGVTGSGRTIEDARANVYDAVKLIKFDGMHYRKDIGSKA